MDQLLALSVGLGLVISLLFTEMFGLAAGGMIVPGYFALYLTDPRTIGLTLAAAIGTFLIVHTLSSVMILYGRRRTAITILVGYVIGMVIRYGVGGSTHPGVDVIGYIIPGLIALWIARQGVIETVSSILMVSVLVRLGLIIIIGEEMLQ